MSEYDIHIGNQEFENLWNGDETGSPFQEDLDDIELAITEMLGQPKRKKRTKRTQK